MRKNPPARYALPDVLRPSDSKCYQISVPNDLKHIAAFQGQIKALASAYLWADDPDHNALLAAEAWKPVFEDLCLNPALCGGGFPSILCISGSFADDPYGYAPAIAAPCSPDYVDGTGWQSCFDSSVGDIIYVIRPFDKSTFVRSYEYHTDGTALFSYDVIVTFFLHGAVAHTHTVTFSAGGPGSIGEDTAFQADLVLVQVVHSTAVSDDTLTLKDWALCYTGDFPMTQPPTTWTSFLDWSIGLFGFTVDYGTQGVGGIVGTLQFGGSNVVAQAEIHFSTPVHLLNCLMIYDESGSTDGVGGARLGFTIGGTFENTFLDRNGRDGTSVQFGGDLNVEVTDIVTTINTGNGSGSNALLSLQVTGSGTKPAGWP